MDSIASTCNKRTNTLSRYAIVALHVCDAVTMNEQERDKLEEYRMAVAAAATFILFLQNVYQIHNIKADCSGRVLVFVCLDIFFSVFVLVWPGNGADAHSKLHKSHKNAPQTKKWNSFSRSLKPNGINRRQLQNSP